MKGFFDADISKTTREGISPPVFLGSRVSVQELGSLFRGVRGLKSTPAKGSTARAKTESERDIRL